MRKGMLFALSLALLCANACVIIGNRGGVQDTPFSPAVAKMVDDKDIVLNKNDGGIVLKNTEGKAFRVSIGENGQLVTTPLK